MATTQESPPMTQTTLPPPVRITEHQRDSYLENGYLLIESYIAPDEV